MVASSIINKLKKNKVEAVIFLLIIIFSAYLRFYDLSGYMTFLGDEGRDALIVKDILVNHHFPLIGPPMSVGDVYLGPLYYYMMAVAMAIFWLNPVAAAGMVALIGIISVGLIYYLTRVWFGKEAAILASVLYTVSPITITYSRSSWNPNPAPLFALLAILGLYRSRIKNNYFWFILTGASLGAIIQMHYLTLILLPVFGLFWLNEILSKREKRNFRVGTIGAIVAFMFLLSPLAIFDLRHNFMNATHLQKLFFSGNSGIQFNLLHTISKIPSIFFNNLIGRYLAADNLYLQLVLTILVLFPFGIMFWKYQKNLKKYWIFSFLFIWLLFGLIGLSFYQESLNDHYLGFISPTIYILLGGLISFLSEWWKKIALILLLVVIGGANLLINPLRYPPNNQLKKTQEVAKFIINASQNKPFNFALLSKNNYDAAYQYFLDIYGHQPAKLPFVTTNQLFVVCEDPVCKPIGNPKYEVAAFGWAQTDWEKDYDGVKIFKLSHYPH